MWPARKYDVPCSSGDIGPRVARLYPLKYSKTLNTMPHLPIEPPRDLHGRVNAADPLQAARRPREPIGTEDEERDRMQAAAVDEDRGLAIEEVAHGAAAQREVRIALESHDRREVQAASEPGLDLMDPAALNLQRMLALEEPQVIVDCLGDQRAGSIGRPPDRPLDIEQGHARDHHRGKGDRGRQRLPPPPPPGGAGGAPRPRPGAGARGGWGA